MNASSGEALRPWLCGGKGKRDVGGRGTGMWEGLWRKRGDEPRAVLSP